MAKIEEQIDWDDARVLGSCGCEGDSEGYIQAIENAILLSNSYDDSIGYGHHSYNEVWVLPNGKGFIHADCGGCSCGGSGNWEHYSGETEALRKIPEE